MSKKKIIILAVVVIVIIIGIALTQVLGNNNTQSAGAMPVNFEVAQTDTIITKVTAKGEVSLLDTELIYASIAAEVEEVLVEKNDSVTKGQPIIRYKEKTREDLETRIREAELSVRSSELSLAQQRLPATESEVEQARINILTAEQEITKINNSLEDLNVKISTQEREIQNAQKDLDKAKQLYAVGAVPLSDVDAVEKDLQNLEDVLDTYLTQKKQTEDSMKIAEENLQYQKLQYNDVTNKTNSQTSQNTIAQRQIDLEKNRLSLEQLRKELQNFQQELYSPIDGTVMSVDVSQGQLTPTDKVLMEIANINDYVVQVDVNERNVSKIAIGQDVTITGSVLGSETVTGKVTKIGLLAESKMNNGNTETIVPVEITVDPSPATELLKPGFSLEAAIITDIRENVVVVPILSTLNDIDGSSYVYVLKEDNTLEKRVVEIGAYSDMTVEVSGLAEGEKVVAQPAMEMYEGMQVIPMGDFIEEETPETNEENGAEGDAQ